MSEERVKTHAGPESSLPRPRLFGNAHLQTLWAPLFRRTAPFARTHEVWPTPDGDVLDVDVFVGNASEPVALVLHGMEGSSRAPYVGGLLERLARRGWGGVAINFRSCGPSPRRGARTYHAGDTRDLALVAERVRERWPTRPLAGVGFSLGGNVLLKWLGEVGTASPLFAAVAVSVPFDLKACAEQIDGPGLWRALYRHNFLRTLRQKARAMATFNPERVDLKRARVARRLADFDAAVTAPLNGFLSVHDYWAKSSSNRFLGLIRTPTLLLSSADDPFVPMSAVPLEIIAANRLLTLRLLPWGGHVGFVGGSPWAPIYVADEQALGFLKERLKEL